MSKLLINETVILFICVSVVEVSLSEKRGCQQCTTSHKHTYLASCHHVGEFGVLIDCQAQNVVTVFYIKTLAG